MDKNKILEAAAKHVAKGAYDKAIKEYQKILEADPKDSRVLQKMGELYQKKGDNAQAAHFFTKVAESYSSDGFFLKAVALYKQVLKLNPNLLDVNLKLAELHQQLGLMSEAMAYFQIVANHYDKSGDTKASLDTLKRMVDLDPENVASKIKLAELYARENMTREALQEFKRAAEYLKRNNRTDDYLRVAERLSTLEPENLPLNKELAQHYLQKGDQKRALARLQVCFKADGRDVDTLNMLAQAFHGLGQTSKTVSVYKELAKVLEERGRTQDSLNIWDRIAALDPEDPDLQARRAPAPSPAPPPEPAATRPPPPQASQPQAPQPQAPQPQAPQPQASQPPPPQATGAGGMTGEQLNKLLTETDVYVKYGLHDKALEHLRKIFTVDPENLDAHEKAYNIYVASANEAAASEQLLNVLRLCTRGAHVERAQPYLAAILQQNPGHPEVPTFLAVLRSSQTGPAAAAPLEAESVQEDAILVVSNDEEIIVAEAPEDALAQPPGDELALVTASASLEAEDVIAEAEAGTDETVLSDEALVGEPLSSSESDYYGSAEPEVLAVVSEDSEEVVSDERLVMGDEPGVVVDGDDEPLVLAGPASDDEEPLVLASPASDDEEPLVLASPVGEDETSFADVSPLESSEYVVEDPALAAAADEDSNLVTEDDEGLVLGMDEEDAPTRVLPPPSKLLDRAAPSAVQRGPASRPTTLGEDDDQPTVVGRLPVPPQARRPEPEPEELAFADSQDEQLVDPFAEPDAQAEASFADVVPDEAPQAEVTPEATPEEEEPAAEECDEAAFFLDQGLLEEAREILETVLIAFSGHRRASELMARLEALEANGGEAPEQAESAPASVPLVQPVRAPERDAFDLAAELAGEFENLGTEATAPPAEDDFQYSVEEVFAEFKKGLQKVVKPEDVDTHYDLGIAYKEMGLLDDAVGEFSVARQGCMGTKREVDCLTMMGMLHGMRGDHASAVATFKEGLASDHASGEVAKALGFELAMAYEALGEGGKALFHFQRVAAQDERYRDVSSHVARLAASVHPEEDELAPAPPLPPAAASNAPRARKVGYV